MSTQLPACVVQMRAWSYGLCIWSVVQALGTIIAATIYLILQGGYAYLAVTSLLMLLNLLAHGFLGAEVKKQYYLAEHTSKELHNSIEDITAPAKTGDPVFEAFGKLNSEAAASHSWAGFFYRSEYQLFYTGPALYTVVMFAIMLRDVTHGKGTVIAFNNFLPLFALVQMQATAMSSLPTFVVTLDTTGSHEDMTVALRAVQEARRFHKSRLARLSAPGSFSNYAERSSPRLSSLRSTVKIPRLRNRSDRLEGYDALPRRSSDTEEGLLTEEGLFVDPPSPADSPRQQVLTPQVRYAAP